MGRNVEIKARIDDFDAMRERVARRSGGAGEWIAQEDVFFRAPTGRLKLRVLSPGHGELIHYHRPDRAGPKESRYTRAPTSDPAALREILAATLEVVGVVRKERLLHFVGQTRVHLDRVEGLGDFLELEVVLGPGQDPGEGTRIARALLHDLGIGEESLLTGAYLDLLRATGAAAADA